MHDAILPRLNELDIKVHFNQRPHLPEQGSQQSITLSNREILTFDLLVQLIYFLSNCRFHVWVLFQTRSL